MDIVNYSAAPFLGRLFAVSVHCPILVSSRHYEKGGKNDEFFSRIKERGRSDFSGDF